MKANPVSPVHMSAGDILIEIRESEYGARGTQVIQLTGNNHNARIWFRIRGTTGEIAGMFVKPGERRMGYATLLFQALLDHYPEVATWTTPSATPSGRDWLRSVGFLPPNDTFEDWHLHRKIVCKDTGKALQMRR